MVKQWIFLIGCLIVGLTAASQEITDRVDPRFQQALDWQEMRDKFLYTQVNGGYPLQAGSEFPIEPTAFFSKSITIEGLNPGISVPEMRPFMEDYAKRRTGLSGSYIQSREIPIFDSLGVTMMVAGIDSGNASQYQFRIIKNKVQEIVSWSDFKLFCAAQNARMRTNGKIETTWAYIGKFMEPFGTSLTFEVRPKARPSEIITVPVLWLKRPPKILGVFTAGNLSSLIAVIRKRLAPPWAQIVYPDSLVVPDSNFVFRSEFASYDNNLTFYFDDRLDSTNLLEYALIRDGDTSVWKPNGIKLSLVLLNDLAPGKYILLTRYATQRHNVSSFPFSIAEAWYQTIWFKILSALFLASVIGFIYQFTRARSRKQKLQIQTLRTQQVQSELKSIRSQFNPHFVFNALSSIQGLITRNDMTSANHYLTEFSNLLRDSLKESNREMTTMVTELRMLDTYVKLEKLRFGFSYEKTIATDINLNSVEVPALILQPLVENAIKHGVSSLYEKGIIQLIVEHANMDMKILIKDNGGGFADQKSGGLGLQLTRDRIALLNSAHPQQAIVLAIDSSDRGSTVSLLFQNWFA